MSLPDLGQRQSFVVMQPQARSLGRGTVARTPGRADRSTRSARRWATVAGRRFSPSSGSPANEISRTVRRRRPRIEDRAALTTIRPNQAWNRSGSRSDGRLRHAWMKTAWVVSRASDSSPRIASTVRNVDGSRASTSDANASWSPRRARATSARSESRDAVSTAISLKAGERLSGAHDRQDAAARPMVDCRPTFARTPVGRRRPIRWSSRTSS